MTGAFNLSVLFQPRPFLQHGRQNGACQTFDLIFPLNKSCPFQRNRLVRRNHPIQLRLECLECSFTSFATGGTGWHGLPP